MSIYYLSNNGSDLNDGLTPESAWASIAKVNCSIKGGDTVKFRCGDTFFGRIMPPEKNESGAPTVYTSYEAEGRKQKPVISQYKIPNKDAWELHSEGIWKIDLSDTAKFTGNITEINNNAGFILVSGVVRAYKKFALDALKEQWDFYNNDEEGKYLYVKSDKNPAELSNDIRIACNIGCVVFRNNLEVTNIIFSGTGGHGISGTVNNAYIADCEFHNIGGSRLVPYPNPTTRYGNGVECWSNSSNVTVERCKFSGIYDVAITMQGNEVKKSWTNMHFRNNEMWNNTQCFEIWSSGDLPDTGFVDCHFENNICINSGYCWGYETRPNKDCSAHLLLYHLDCPLCDISVKNNFFYGAREASIFKSGGYSMIPEGYKIEGNVFVNATGHDLVYRGNDSEDEKYNEYCMKLVSCNTVMTSEEAFSK